MEANSILNSLGILFQIIGVLIGAYVITKVKYRQGPFDPEIFDPNIISTGDDTSNLPKHPQTKKPLFPLIFNRKVAALSITSLVAGLMMQFIASL